MKSRKAASGKSKKASGKGKKTQKVRKSPPKSTKVPKKQTPWLEWGIAAVVILVLSFVLYGRTASYDFVLDDKIVITENSYVKEGKAGIGQILKTESFTGFLGEQKDLVVGARYRPLSLVTFAMESELYEHNSEKARRMGHLGNVFLYGLTGLMIFMVLGMFIPTEKDKKWFLAVPFAAALLFILHPLHTEVVANIKGRDEIMALFFSLATVFFILRAAKYEELLSLLLAPILFFLGLLSKENTITMILVIPLLLHFFSKVSLKRMVILMAPLLLVTVLFLVIRTNVIGYFLSSGQEVTQIMNNPFYGTSFGEKTATISYTLLLYVKLLIFPHPLTHDYYPYHIPILNWADPRAIAGLLVYLGMIVVAVWQWKKNKIISFSILYYLITLSIVSNVVFPVGVFMGERFMFMPSVGFCLLLTWLLLHKLPEKLPFKFPVGLLVLGLFMVGFTIKTYERTPAWENEAALNEAAIKISTGSARANQFYAYSLYRQALSEPDRSKKRALVDTASVYVDKALSIYPTYTDALTTKGGVLTEYYGFNGDINALLDGFYAIQTAKPNDFVDQYLTWLNGRGRHQRELADFYYKLGYQWFCVELKDKESAKKYLNMGLKVMPGDANLTQGLAQCQ